MTPRDAALVGLRDTLDHLDECRKQLEWTHEPQAVALLTEAMQRDLERCRRLIEKLPRSATPAKPA